MVQTQAKPKMSFAFVTSVFVALVLMLLPLPQWLFYFWPDWIVLVILHWALMTPTRIGPMVALFVSVFLEVLFVRNFGIFGTGLIIVVFLVNRMHLQLRVLSVWQQAIVIALFIALFKLVTGWLNGMVADFIISIEYWYSLVGDILIWPFLTIILSAFRHDSSR